MSAGLVCGLPSPRGSGCGFPRGGSAASPPSLPPSLRGAVLQRCARLHERKRLRLPAGLPARVAIFARKELAEKAKAHADLLITPEELGDLSNDKRRARKVVDGIDYFVAEISMMADIGKLLGVVLGPRGKMPRPVPPTADIARIIDGLRNLVVLRSRDRPTFHVPIGTVAMEQEQLAENLETVLKRVESHLDRGDQNIASVWVKTTMGKAVRI